MFEARFCPRCGAPLIHQRMGNRTRPVCPQCHFVYYMNPVVAAGTLIEKDSQVLLVRRGVEPGQGQWGLPAGYAEAGESPEETAIRETKEETGVLVELDGLLGIYPFTGETPSGGVLILYRAHVTHGVPKPGDDALEARFFPANALPKEIAFETHRQVLAEWARVRAILCREATTQDSKTVLHIAKKFHLTAPAPWEEYLKEAELLVALDVEGKVVGFVSFTSDLRKRAVIHIEHIFVLPNYRRWGIGTRLLGAMQKAAIERQVHTLITQLPADNPALRLFLRTGFQVCGFLAYPEGPELLLCHRIDDSQ